MIILHGYYLWQVHVEVWATLCLIENLSIVEHQKTKVKYRTWYLLTFDLVSARR